jgi:phage I-like protein
MDKTAVLVALGLPQDASDQTALTALAALSGQMKAKAAEIAALRSNQFDPAKHIPLDEHHKATQALAALQAAQDKVLHDGLMAAALGDGRIFAANESYWRAQPVAALQEFLKTAQPIAALAGTQTGGKAPVGAAAGGGGTLAALSAEQLDVCAQLGVSPEDFVKAGGK